MKKYEVTIKYFIERTITYTVKASSKKEAEAKAKNDDYMDVFYIEQHGRESDLLSVEEK